MIVCSLELDYFFLLLLLFAEFSIRVRLSYFLLFPVLGAHFVPLGLDYDSLEQLHLLPHLLVQCGLDPVQMVVDVLSEPSRERQHLLHILVL